MLVVTNNILIASSADNIYAQDNMEGYTALFAANNDQGSRVYLEYRV